MKMNRNMVDAETDFDTCKGPATAGDMRPQLGNLDQKIETLFGLNTGTEMKLNRKMVGPETDFDTCKGAWYKSD
jgi:hypothetical protein